MLVPAILYKDEIYKKLLEYSYSEDMFYYTGWLGNSMPEIGENSDGARFQYAIVDNVKLIGYFEYQINWYSSCANCFGLFSFDRNNNTIGLDVYRKVKELIKHYRLHRLEWRMIGGNAVEKHYDSFCRKHNGKKFVLTDAVKDKYGKYHNDVIYEIIFDNAREAE